MQKMKTILITLVTMLLVVTSIVVVDAKDDGKSVNLGSLAPVEDNCVDDGEEEKGIDLSPKGKLENILIIDTEWAKSKVKEWKEEEAKAKAEAEAKAKAEAEAKAKAAAAAKEKASSSSSSSSSTISASYFCKMGVYSYGGYKWTWYSQRVLSGSGLNIPGRYVDDYGFVCDYRGYIVLARPAGGSYSKGQVIMTPFGRYGCFYDYCPEGRIDVYVNW